jgi:hypothetical protein
MVTRPCVFPAKRLVLWPKNQAPVVINVVVLFNSVNRKRAIPTNE